MNYGVLFSMIIVGFVCFAIGYCIGADKFISRNIKDMYNFNPTIADDPFEDDLK